MAKKERLYQYKKIRSKGAILYLFKQKGDEHWKFHNWDGPAIKPQSKNCELTKSYYLYGTLYSEEDYLELVKQREGLPWFKSPSMKGEVRI